MRNTLFVGITLFFLLGKIPSSAQTKPKAVAQEDWTRVATTRFTPWLRNMALETTFSVAKAVAQNGKIVLYLKPVQDFSCEKPVDPIEAAHYQHYQQLGQYHLKQFEAEWLRITGKSVGQAQVVVRCLRTDVHQEGGVELMTARGFQSSESIPKSKGEDPPAAEFSMQNSIHLPKETVVSACGQGFQFCQNWYMTRGSWFRKAKIEVLYKTDKEFEMRVTYLRNEICPDGYFEMHNIRVEFIQKGADVEANLVFSGWYGSGIITPPRLGDYKEMQSIYVKELANYDRIFRKSFAHYIAQQ